METTIMGYIGFGNLCYFQGSNRSFWLKRCSQEICIDKDRTDI